MVLLYSKIKFMFKYILLLLCFSCGNQMQNTPKITSRQPVLPILAQKDRNQGLQIQMTVTDTVQFDEVVAFEFSMEGTTDMEDIANVKVLYNTTADFENASVFGELTDVSKKFSIQGNRSLTLGENYFWLSVGLKGIPTLTNSVALKLISATFSNGTELEPEHTSGESWQRIGLALKQAGEQGVNTYRIPGLTTTNNGTLIAVYDNRYNDPVDLQEDIDVGMSRSIDGGQTWEPMKVIMDMGEFGGLPEDQNGIGDPAVLVDRSTNTIWVAALWLHGYPGQRAWNASEPGIQPERTGQLMLVKSEDDGVTWSKPINITPQTKEEKWQLFFNGPGSGITMKNGTLVFAAQYKDEERVPHSTIIYSIDHGTTWNVGTGAKSETTEAQVVELLDGSLMLNMRDDRNRFNRKDSVNGRSVAITKDMGKTWIEHATSRKALIEPNCMASIIGMDDAEKGKVLFFSNPNSKTARNHITIKTSFDQGSTWPLKNQMELYEDDTYGYSSMTVIDEEHLGILYEGNQELYFEKIPINELLSPEIE